MLRLWKACAILALLCLLAGSAAAQVALGLGLWVGKKPDKEFMTLPAVHDPLARLMGERLDQFLSRFQVVTPIDRVASDFVVQGCLRRDCAGEQVAFTIDVDTGQASAASLTRGRYMDIYSQTTTSYNSLPPGLRRWISSRTSQSAFRKIKFRFHK